MAHNLGRGIAILAGPDLHGPPRPRCAARCSAFPAAWSARLAGRTCDSPRLALGAAFLTALTRITAIPGEAALAMNRPDGRCVSPADFSSAMDCPTMACRRWSASISTSSPGRSVTKAW